MKDRVPSRYSKLQVLLDQIARTAALLAEQDAYTSWRLRGQFGYPRTKKERLGAPTTYLKLLDEQERNIEELTS